MKILLLSRYGQLGASSRVRCYQYLERLRSEGFEIDAKEMFNDQYLRDLYAGRPKRWDRAASAYARRAWELAWAGRYDLIWLEKEALPWLPAWAERALSAAGIPYLVDYDDAIFHYYDLHPRGWVRGLLGRKIDTVMARARIVIAGNEYLADRARSAGAARVEILPSVVDLDHYRTSPPPSGKPLTVGWIGSPTAARYLAPLRETLTAFCGKTGARLLLIGAGNFRLDMIPGESRSWAEEREAADIASFDIGIMPLLGDRWDEGKCGYKLIQYMAAARPVIASPVGVNKTIVDASCGLLARTPEQWLNALLTLAADAGLRRKMGEAGRRKVEKFYCVQVTAPKLAQFLREAAASF